MNISTFSDIDFLDQCNVRPKKQCFCTDSESNYPTIGQLMDYGLTFNQAKVQHTIRLDKKARDRKGRKYERRSK